jgi:protein-tyrosine phosphatase
MGYLESPVRSSGTLCFQKPSTWGGSIVASVVVDIHSHILPGLDDGPKTLEESVAMLHMAADSGTSDIVATPHANLEFAYDPELIDRKIQEVQGAVGALPRIHRGCDFHLTMENIQDALAQPAKYSIDGRGYLLVEFSDSLIPRTTQDIFDRFRTAGLTPIVTHPERNAMLQTRLDQLKSWVENGALVQVTAQALLGGFGRTARTVSTELMNRRLVHFIASDAHDSLHRTPVLSDAYRHVAKVWGEATAETLFFTAPRAAVQGEPIDPVDLEPMRPKPKWYRLGR